MKEPCLQPRIGYLCSEFPALSHTFISREIAILEREGIEVLTASINLTRNPDMLGPADLAYAVKTFYVKATPRLRIAALGLRYLFLNRGFLRAAAFARGLASRSGPRDSRKAAGYFVEALLLHAWARQNGIGHVHVHFANPAATVALIATRFGGLEYSLSVHGPDEFYDVSVNNVREKVEGAVFVRCISHYCRSQLMRLTSMEQWGKLRIVRCGIFKDEFAQRSTRPEGPRTIVCTGRLCPSKGQAMLVEAAGMLLGRGLDFRVVLLGGGEDMEALKDMVARRGLEGRVAIVGPVGHERVRQELALADLFVLPSFAEGVPVALMEAMASGVPVLSTAIMGIPELVEDRVSGLLVQPSNVEQLASAIEEVLSGSVDAASLVKNAVAKVREDYDVEANTRALAGLFRAEAGL